MGKGIIFVGGGNLNRNRNHQSMYTGNKYNQYAKQNSRREAFYKELCLESKKLLSIKSRNKKIKQLSLKYQSNACSEKTMQKIFTAYTECFHGNMKSKEKKKRILDLPGILEKNKVDKRVIKRILEIEGLENIDINIKKDSFVSHTVNAEIKTKSNKNERLKKFHEMLNEYLIESYFSDQIIISHELERTCKLFNRDSIYLNDLKIVYREMIENGLTFLESCEKYNFHIYKTDLKGLSKNWSAYKKTF